MEQNSKLKSAHHFSADFKPWSMKTVKANDPFSNTNVRLISGRCSPDYSYGITDPHKDVQKTGEAVLNIWNERINIATDHYSRVRTAVLVRSYDLLSYRLFEEETQRYRTTDYHWTVNDNGDLIGLNHKEKVCFTWQPHGSQFTIHTEVPEEAVKFRIKRPPTLKKDDVLKSIDFDESWITILDSCGGVHAPMPCVMENVKRLDDVDILKSEISQS